MNEALRDLWSWQMGIGFALGYLTRYLWCHWHARWLDRHRPFADGHRHRRPQINRTWIGGGLALMAVAFSLVSTQDTRDRTLENVRNTEALAKSTLDCENRLTAAIVADHNLQMENDALAADERELTNQSLRAASDYLTLVVTPPQNIFDLHTTDPKYQEWARGVTQQYLDKLMTVQQKLQAISDKREAVVAERNQHPLPSPTCTK